MKCINCGTQIPEGHQQCDGCSVKVDEAYRSLIVLAERADAGDAKAQGELAKVYLAGTGGVKKDYYKAKKLFKAAFDQGEALGYYGVGQFFLRGFADTPIDYDRALELAKKAVEMNSLDGMRLMGNLYKENKWVGHDDTEAVKWYQKAAEQGDAVAQNRLGFIYEKGRGVMQSDMEAVKWYQKAAEQGHAVAQTNLGVMYQYGRGVSKSDIEAVKWYQKAAEQGQADAQNNLGLMYEDGRGVSKSDIEAVKWYQKAAEQGNAFAQNNLGCMYKSGRGVSKSDIEAARWYKKAAEQGEPFAQKNLGLMYEDGRGIAKNIAEAQKLLTKAAESDHANYFFRAGFFIRQRAYDKAVLDWYRYYDNSEPEKTDVGEFKDWSQWIYSHLSQELMPRIKVEGHRFIYYSPCFAIINYQVEQTFFRGTSLVKTYGNNGAGYFVLTDQGIYVSLLLVVTNQYCEKKKSGLRYWLSRDTGEYEKIMADNLTYHSYKSIHSYSMDEYKNLLLIAGSQTQISSLYTDGASVIEAAIVAAHNGLFAVAQVSEVEEGGSNNKQDGSNHVMKLKALKELLDAGVLTETEYAEKKAKVLKDMGL